MAFLVTALVLAFAVSAGVVWSGRRREEPLRKEMQARTMVTFRASVDVKDQRGPLYLTVRGDLFEVSHPFPLARFLFGQDYCYRAEDTTVWVVPGLWHDWIEIGGVPGTGLAPILIGRRKMNRQIWDVLVRAGAHPIGPSPQP